MNKLFILIFCLCPGLVLGYEWLQTETSVALKDGDEIIWQHVHDLKEAKPFFHPVKTPAGITLTDLKPADHVWHRGLWFSWKYINGVNYWEERKGRSPGTTNIVDVDVQTRADFSALITLEIHYFQKPDDVLMTETRVMEVSAPNEGSYTISWKSSFTAIKDVELTRTPIVGEKGGRHFGGYAGLSLRAAREFSKDEAWKFVNQDGASIKHSSKARAVSLRGPKAALTISPESSQLYSWYLFKKMPYFSPALLFDKKIQLPRGSAKKISYQIKIEDL